MRCSYYVGTTILSENSRDFAQPNLGSFFSIDSNTWTKVPTRFSSRHIVTRQTTGAMKNSSLGPWLRNNERRQAVLKQLDQPMTPVQLHRRVALSRSYCSELILELSTRGLVACLNPKATCGRVYGLTILGRQWRQKLWPHLAEYVQPEGVDWQIYGKMCFNHRDAIIKVLYEPMNPAAMKRQALRQFPDICMSANNVRDMVPKLVKLGVLEAVSPSQGYTRYTLTPQGMIIRQLLLKAWDRSSLERRK